MSITRPLGVGTFGQSFVQEGYDLSSSYQILAKAIMREFVDNHAAIAAATSLAIQADSGVALTNIAVGGSAVLQAHASPVDNYWVRSDGSAGPVLTDGITKFGAASTKPLCLIYGHGQQDVGYLATETDSYDVQAAITNRILPDVRQAAATSGTGANLPIWVDMIGPRFPTQEFGEYWLRDRFIEIVQNGTRIFMGAETYSFPLDNTVHPSDELGYLIQGASHGRKIAYFLSNTSNATGLRGPQISSAVIEGVSVAVTFTIPAGKTMLKPTRPDYFGLFDATENRIDIRDYVWSSDTKLYLTCDTLPTKLRYPCSIGRPVNYNNIIRLSDPTDDALFTGEPGLVLESTKTITL